MYAYVIASVLGLILASLTGILLHSMGLHGVPGIIASAITGIVIAVLTVLPLCRKSSK